MAKNGPIVRYSMHVKNMEYGLLTRLPSSNRPPERLIPRAATARSGIPTPVTQKPATAGQTFLPAICPICTGNIRLPAPKNIPNSILAMYMYSLILSFSFITIPHAFLLFPYRNSINDPAQDGQVSRPPVPSLSLKNKSRRCMMKRNRTRHYTLKSRREHHYGTHHPREL